MTDNFNGGTQNRAGRPRGSRNRLADKFLKDLLADWEVNGVEAIKICRIEDPTGYVKLVAGILPKEFQVSTESHLADLNDDDIRRLIEFAERRLAEDARRAEIGIEQAREREPAVASLPAEWCSVCFLWGR